MTKVNRRDESAWKEVIVKEMATKKQWESKYGKNKATKERQFLLQTLVEKIQQERDRCEFSTSPERKLLYEGVSKEDKGRKAYLQAQRTKSPQQKNSRPLTSSQVVGWFCEGSRSEVSRYSRKAILAETFFRNHGIN